MYLIVNPEDMCSYSDNNPSDSSHFSVLLSWSSYVISVLLLLCFRARLFIVALWSPAGKELTAWLSFAMSSGVLTFPFVSLVRCGA